MRAPHGGLEGEGNQPQDRDLPAGQSRVQEYSSRRPGIPGWPGRVADDLLQFDWCNKINGQSGVLLCWQPCACYTACMTSCTARTCWPTPINGALVAGGI